MLKSIAVVSWQLPALGSSCFWIGPIALAEDPGGFRRGPDPVQQCPSVEHGCLRHCVDPLCLALRPLRSGPCRTARAQFFILGEATVNRLSGFPTGGKDLSHWYWLSWLLTWPIGCWAIRRLLPLRKAGSVALEFLIAFDYRP